MFLDGPTPILPPLMNASYISGVFKCEHSGFTAGRRAILLYILVGILVLWNSMIEFGGARADRASIFLK